MPEEGEEGSNNSEVNRSGQLRMYVGCGICTHVAYVVGDTPPVNDNHQHILRS